MDTHWIRPLIGRPWRAYATGLDAYDCWGVVAHALRTQYGVEADRHLDVISGDDAGFHAAVLKEAGSGRWRQCDSPVDGCVVLMARMRRFQHVGIWVDVNGGRVLHSHQSAGVSLDSIQQLQVLGFRKFEYWQAV